MRSIFTKFPGGAMSLDPLMWSTSLFDNIPVSHSLHCHKSYTMAMLVTTATPVTSIVKTVTEITTITLITLK